MTADSSSSAKKSPQSEDKMKRGVAFGFALTLLGALIIEVTVLLALCNLISLANIPHAWLIGALIVGGVLLVLGWFFGSLFAPSDKR